MFDAIGGKDVVDKLVDDFYFIMRTDPEARDCYATHSGKDIAESAQKLKFFLSGWLGGPKLYQETYGHPRLRMRHFPFTISFLEAKQWLYCMDLALSRSSIPQELQDQIFEAFKGVAQMLINKEN